MTKTLLRYVLCFLAYANCVISTHAITVNRALVIGLGQQEDNSWLKINGDNDVYYVVKMLQDIGYTDIRTLKNQKATKSAIINALNALSQRCCLGDNVYIHYSGHGQLMTDLNGDESVRWNGWHAYWDESLIPYDAYMVYGNKDRGDKHISDDELAEILTKIRSKVGRKGHIIVVIDSCHSGDATHGDIDEITRGVDTKFSIPRKADAPVANPIPEQWLTISACQPYQLCTEIKDKRIGKLTYALYSMRKTIFKLSNKEIEKQLDDFIGKYVKRVPQNPMVSGRKTL